MEQGTGSHQHLRYGYTTAQRQLTSPLRVSTFHMQPSRSLRKTRRGSAHWQPDEGALNKSREPRQDEGELNLTRRGICDAGVFRTSEGDDRKTHKHMQGAFSPPHTRHRRESLQLVLAAGGSSSAFVSIIFSFRNADHHS